MSFVFLKVIVGMQRAMDLYKKQSTEIRTRPIAAVSDQEMVETNVPLSDEVKAEEPVPSPDQETSKEMIQTFAQKKAEEPVAVAGHEIHEELASAPSHEVQSEEAADADGPIPMVMDEMAQEPEKPVDGDGSCFPSLGNSSQTALATAMSSDDNDVKGLSKTDAGGDDVKGASKSDDNHSADDVDEMQAASGHAMSVPSFCPDGSPKACKALMPESNESESVILSRIHHSPESTH